MRVNPIDYIFEGKDYPDINFYFVSGNEYSLMEKIRSVILNSFKIRKDTSVTYIENISRFQNDIGLFEDRRFVIVNNAANITIEKIEDLKSNNLFFLFTEENTTKVNKIKSIFLKRNDSILFDCYELDRDKKIVLLNKFFEKNNLSPTKEIFWYLVENIDTRYLFFEKDIEKIISLQKEYLSLENVRKIITADRLGVEKIIFEIFKSNNILINSYNSKVKDENQLSSFFYYFKNYSEKIIENNNIKDFDNCIPKYLFREKVVYLEIFRKFNNNKKEKLIVLLRDCELKLRKNTSLELRLVIGLRFLLNVKRLVIS